MASHGAPLARQCIISFRCLKRFHHYQRSNVSNRRLHGFGVFALETINKNTRIIDYAGELIGTSKAKRARSATSRRAASGCFASTGTGAATPPSAATSRASSIIPAGRTAGSKSTPRPDDLGTRRKADSQGPGTDLRLQHRGRQGDSLPVPAGVQDQAMKWICAAAALLVCALVVCRLRDASAGQAPAQVAYFTRSLDDPRDRQEARADILDTPVLPGSIVKTVALVAALESGVITGSIAHVPECEGRRPGGRLLASRSQAAAVAGRSAGVFLQRFLRLARAAIDARSAQRLAHGRGAAADCEQHADGLGDSRTGRPKDDAARVDRRDGTGDRIGHGQTGADASRDEVGSARRVARRGGLRNRIFVQGGRCFCDRQDRDDPDAERRRAGARRGAHARRQTLARHLRRRARRRRYGRGRCCC